MLLMIWGFPWLVSVPSFRSKIGADCERGGHEHKQEGQYESDVSKCAYTCIHMYICMKKNRNMLHRYERAKRKDDIHLTSILSVSGSVHVVRELITWSRNYWWTWAEFINFSACSIQSHGLYVCKIYSTCTHASWQSACNSTDHCLCACNSTYSAVCKNCRLWNLRRGQQSIQSRESRPYSQPRQGGPSGYSSRS